MQNINAKHSTHHTAVGSSNVCNFIPTDRQQKEITSQMLQTHEGTCRKYEIN